MGRPRYFRRIFALFLAAAMAPAAAISLVYTSLAGAALRREAESRLDSQSAAFAMAIASIADSCARDLSAVASDRTVLMALGPGASGDPASGARAFRRILSAFPSNGGPAEASVVSADGLVALRLGDQPQDRNLDAYGSWGIFRALASTAIAVSPRVAQLSDGTPAAFSIGISIRDDSGTRLGYALADVRRSALAAAAVASGLQGGSSVVFPSGKIVFDQSDPSVEGLYLYQLPQRGHDSRTSTSRAVGAGNEFTVIAESPSSLYAGFGRAARNVALAGLAGAAGLAAVLALRASASVTRPVLEMALSMRQVEAGDLSIRIEPSGDDELGDLARSFNAMTAEMDALMKSRVERQELLREAELRALAAQMNPHFLHNTLASIKSLAKLGRASEIAEVVSRLGKILRAGAGRREGPSTIGEGLQSVRDYLSIEKVRFGDRFTFTIDVGQELLRVEVPPLTLEPLAENALTHGLERKRGQGTLSITGRTEGKTAVISFVDDGPGMETAAMAELAIALAAAEAPSGSHGIGLLGTNRRLALEYGRPYGLRIDSGVSGSTGFVVELRVPMTGQTGEPA